MCTRCPRTETCKPLEVNLGLGVVDVLVTGRETLADSIRRQWQACNLPDYKCENCGRTHTTVKVPQILAGPEILRIQLGLWNKGLKNTNSIKIPKILDLSEYTVEVNEFANPANEWATNPETNTTQRLAKPEDPTSYWQGMTDKLEYRLSSVISHWGEDIRSGHYLAAVQGPHKSTTYVINDDVVETRPSNDLQNNPQVFDDQIYNAYALTYVRTSTR